MLLSGLVLWKPVQFHELSLLMGQYEGARYVHFFGMVGIVLFLIVHIALTLLVPKVLLPMITGRAPTIRRRPQNARSLVMTSNLERRLRESGLAKGDVVNLQRRLFLRHGLSFGALTMLSGCDVVTNTGPVDAFLRGIGRFNDGVQAAAVQSTQAGADLPRTAWCRPSSASTRNTASTRFRRSTRPPGGLQPSGARQRQAGLDARAIAGPAAEDDVTRHVCVEGWSMIGKWGGVPLRTFLEKAGADLTARYVSFHCDDPISYSTSIDMASALHPQTILCLTYAGQADHAAVRRADAGENPTKLGFKQPKFVSEIRVTNEYPAGYWENYGYNWFAGL